MQNTVLPLELENLVSKEKILFTIKAGREKPLSTGVASIWFWIIWSIFILMFVYILNSSTHSIEGQTQEIISENIQNSDMTDFHIMLWFLGLFWIWFILYWIYNILKKWWYFIWTENWLIYFNKWDIKNYKWDDFTNNFQKKWANLILELKTWFTVSHSSWRWETFVHHRVFISSIQNALEILEILKNKIR